MFDHSLEETADLVGSTVGGVKAALNRGRSKLAKQPIATPSARAQTSEAAALLRLYVERFNQRDWDGLRDLIAADARVIVADRFVGSLPDAPYFATYERMAVPWRLSVGGIDGEAAIVVEHEDSEGGMARTLTRLRVSDGRIVGITDYWYCPWMLAAAETVLIG